MLETAGEHDPAAEERELAGALPPGVSPEAWPRYTVAPRPYREGDATMRSRPADPALKTPTARRTAVSLGKQLHALRQERGLTQAAAAALLGWEQPHWARLEAGHTYPTLATLDLLASRLRVQIVLTPDPKGLVVRLDPVTGAA
jgi:DNA-binding XRE family transcriptional regulator